MLPSLLVAAADALEAAVVARDGHGAAAAAEPDGAVPVDTALVHHRSLVFAIIVMPIARLADAHAADRRVDRDALGERSGRRERGQRGDARKQDQELLHGFLLWVPHPAI